jgi:predicted ATPase
MIDEESSEGLLSAPTMTLARRIALRSYRLTSAELKRRSDYEIAQDTLLVRPLRIGAFAIWCFCAATGCATALIGTVRAEFTSPLAVYAVWSLLIATLLTGIAFWIAGRVVLGVSLDVRKTTVSENIGRNVAYRDVEQVRAKRQKQERELFYRNVRDQFVLRTFRWNNIGVFEDGAYPFAPRVNVILGKNGYGKTLLLRTLAAVLQREVDYSGQLFSTTSGNSRLVATVTRNNKLEEIVRDPVYFEDNVGKIPLLAIPDSRFVNRSVRSVSSSPTGGESLAESGARNYLTQEPYENIVVELLAQMSIEYVSKRGGFKRPIFHLIQDVVRHLTDDELFSFARIEEKGRTGFEIYVYTAGSRDVPIPIQSASQGTFSIIAIFGLIYSFLKSLNPDEDRILQTPGIVIIDEIDAHLHPSWQQKVLGLLTSRFPNVQFIVSAHSPAMVAGCDRGEVAVFRRDPQTDHFRIEILQRDFLGATAAELYREIFEIEDADRLYLEYTAKAAIPKEVRNRELAALESKNKLTYAEELRTAELEREKRLIEKAANVREERLQREYLESTVKDLEEQVGRLQREVNRLRSEQSTMGQESPR